MDKFQNNYVVPENERTITVHTRKIKCDLDHPVVYYQIGTPSYLTGSPQANSVECEYCGMRYVYVGDSIL